jgi:transcriptional regulator with XRE-family HTH domain
MRVAKKRLPAAEDKDELLTGSNAPPNGRNLERALGLQVRSIRRTRDLSLMDVATASAISQGTLSKIENGQITPSLSTIQSVANALGVPLSALFAGAEERRDCSVVKANQGVIIERRGTKVGHVYELIGHALGGEVAMEPFVITLREGAAPYTAFHHDGLELIYILTGSVGYRHGEQVYDLNPGDAMMFDSAAPHGPERLYELPTTYLSIIVYARR